MGSRREHSKDCWCYSSCLTCRQPESEPEDRAYHLCTTYHSQKRLWACQKPGSRCLNCKRYSRRTGAGYPPSQFPRRKKTRPALRLRRSIFSSQFLLVLTRTGTITCYEDLQSSFQIL